MEYEIEGRVVVKLNHAEGSKTSDHIATDFNLNISDNLNRDAYFNSDQLPNANGAKTLTVAFINGLSGNIHYAHQKGYWNDAEHLRYIISELEKQFVAHAKVYDSNFTS